MSAYADTSFVLSWFLPDANHSAAVSHITALRRPARIPWTPWNAVEFNNSIRALGARNVLDPSAPSRVVRQVQTAFKAVDLLATPLPVYRWWSHAEEVSRGHTVRIGVRTLDLLHVSAALALGAADFLTFDQRQRTLAEAVGLRVLP